MNTKTFFSVCVLICFFCLFTTSCEPGKKDFCSTTDKRFACTGYLGLDDNYIFFNQVPAGVYTLQKPFLRMEGDEKRVDCSQVIKEEYVFNGIEKDRKYYFDCIPKEKGRYTMDMKIMHSEPQSYQPVKGETCLLMSQGGYQSKWQCTASAYYIITVK